MQRSLLEKKKAHTGRKTQANSNWLADKKTRQLKRKKGLKTAICVQNRQEKDNNRGFKEGKPKQSKARKDGRD